MQTRRAFALVIAALVSSSTLALAAETPDWIKRSNEDAQPLLKVFGDFGPEFAARTGVAGYDDKGKAKLWSLTWITNMGINVAEPLTLPDGRVFVTSGYGVGCGLVRVVKNPKADGGWTAD